MIDELRLRREIERFNFGMVPFGYADIQTAVETALEGGKDVDWLVSEIEEYMDSVGITKLSDIDPCFIAYYGLLQVARNDIDELLDIDIMNDVSSEVYVYGNYMCTSLDGTSEAYQELNEILNKVSEEDMTQAIKWLKEEVDI